MDPETWRRLETIFNHAIELPESDRAAYLSVACEDDETIRAEVEAMLAAHQTGAAHQLLPSAAVALTVLGPGSRVGPYRLAELIGRGGMGEVYRAVREDEFRHEVAIKVVRAERATAELMARFYQERQILASLTHPNIATLLDGGSTTDGQPYLVMQYVDGVPITRYALEHHLDAADRLRLFVAVCETVQFAHGRLVVHRDLKPSNILVMPDGQPRLLDFGIAKLLDTAAVDSTTGDLLLLTPEHAAPEQFLGNAITTATDVYALGVLLYELLTGTRPFTKVPASELARAVAEREPRAPSTVCAVPADLDQICLKALRKEPARRYASAGQLAEDVMRYLGGWPVIARPDTVGYRVRRFVGRHRLGVAGAVLVGATVVTATGAIAWQSNQRAAALAEARLERTRSGRVVEFLVSIFRANNPSETRGRTVTARELLDQARARIGTSLGGEPRIRSELEFVMSRAFYELGQYATADSIAERVVTERRGAAGWPALETATAVEQLGRIKATRGDLAEAKELLREAIGVIERERGVDAPEIGAIVGYLGIVIKSDDPVDSTGEVRRHLERGVRLLRSADSVDQFAVANLLRNLAVLDDDQGRAAEAMANYREALAMAVAAFGGDEEHPRVFNFLENYAFGLQATGQADSAIAVHRRLLALRRKVFGPEDPNVAFSLFNLARDLARVGRFEESFPLFRECIALREKAFGQAHPQVFFAVRRYGIALGDAGRVAEGLPLIERAAAMAETVFGPTNLGTIETLETLAAFRIHLGRTAAALSVLEILGSRGYRNFGRAEYQPLAKEPRFRALVGRGA